MEVKCESEGEERKVLFVFVLFTDVALTSGCLLDILDI